jgi:2-keto-4-pentenoate hydratase/2-oxohepta-3-ene-1,7-dioic acid hydratase in catechol pathway
MKLVTFKAAGADRVGVLDEDGVVPLEALVADVPADMIGVIAAGAPLLAEAAKALAGGASHLPLAEVTLLPPIPRPGKILCLGLNYVEHAAEGGHDVPDYPAVFMRCATSLVGAGAPVFRPKVSDKLDYEAELTIVIGKRAHDVSEAEALDCVFGYTLMNDVSVRDYQRKTTQWTMGKNFDGTGPMGPGIVTKDELPAGADGLGIRTRLNGQTVQNASTEMMVFKVPRIVHLVSQVMTLEPGDVIATGTPSGVAHARKPPLWMKAGDVIEVEVDGIGTLTNPIVDAA